ncbi:MAG: hypothetical protein U1E64_00635 [Sphingomonadaceae bacterium]
METVLLRKQESARQTAFRIENALLLSQERIRLPRVDQHQFAVLDICHAEPFQTRIAPQPMRAG